MPVDRCRKLLDQVLRPLAPHSSGHGGRGFTVVESLIAILLLGIVFAGGMAFYFQANALYFSGLNARLAASIASSRMEVCRNAGFAALPGGDCPAETNAPLTSGPLAVLAGTRTVAVSAVGTVKLVAVTISWNDPARGARSVSLQTYMGP